MLSKSRKKMINRLTSKFWVLPICSDKPYMLLLVLGSNCPMENEVTAWFKPAGYQFCFLSLRVPRMRSGQFLAAGNVSCQPLKFWGSHWPNGHG